jgi:two-component system sensor histidine kinase/response regulator
MTLNSQDILIVDDSPDNLRVLSGILGKQGYKVRASVSGPMALKAVYAKPPDLILLDIKMPEMDGYELCQRLKAASVPAIRDIPIIFISALGETQDKVQALTIGGVDYITKPFQFEEVLARVQTHLSLRALQKSLQAQVAELDAFAHTVAHDIKAPLGVLIGYAEELYLHDEKLTPQERAAALLAIAQGGRKLNQIVEALLLLASVRQIVKVPMQHLDMATIVAEARQRLADLAEKRQTEISAPQDWPAALGYGPWVEEVWVNYLSNAIKYGGQPPCVELGFDQPANADPRSGQTRFWVRDNGAGVAPQDQARLFTPFERLEQAKLKGGHGLGLSIVQRIVEKMGGRVGVESRPGQGSTFFFTLPKGEG